MNDDEVERVVATLGRAKPHEEMRSQPGGLVLTVIQGDDKGAEFRPLGTRILVGRGPRCDVRLSDSSVSSNHLELVLTASQVVLKDLTSRNGSWVGKALVEEAVLADGAEFAAGRCVMRLESVAMRPVPVLKDPVFGNLVGASQDMRTLFAFLDRVAPTKLPVLLLGETGTGKGEVARAIHEASGRRGALVVRNCSAFPKDLVDAELFGHAQGAYTGAAAARLGAFAAADGGTLFLDEIGELPLEQQAKLLTVLDSGDVLPVGSDVPRRVDVRVVAATNRDLASEVEQKRFRSDLYFRLARLRPIVLPPLRGRREDIPLLVQRFLEELRGETSRELSIDDDALAVLGGRYWEGNVRQLRDVVVASALLLRGTVIRPADLLLHDAPLADRNALGATMFELPLRESTAVFERMYCENLLRRCHGNLDEACQLSGYTRPGLVKVLRRAGLNVE